MRTLEEILSDLEEAKTQAKQMRQKVHDLVKERRITQKKTKLVNLLYELIKEKAI